MLRPAGKARFDNRVVDVISEGPFISADADLEVIATSGNRDCRPPSLKWGRHPCLPFFVVCVTPHALKMPRSRFGLSTFLEST